MIIKKREYEKATEGVHNVIVTKVEDLGPQETQNGTKNFLRVIFTCQDQVDKEGNKVEVWQKVSQVLSPKSNLSKLLNQLGITPGLEFDTDDIIGIKTQIVVEHVEKDGQTYANVASVIKQKRTTTI